MDNETTVQRTMLVDAAPSMVWHVLTSPDLAKLYNAGRSVITTWKRGTSVRWVEKLDNGDQALRAQGTVMANHAAHRLRFTYYEPASGLPDEPASYTTVDISLEEERDGRTLVRFWQGDFAGLPHDARRAREAGRYWVEVLVGLKRTAEEQMSQRAA
jgi:uncharacterized protein YndB with AHSA1/START domain